MKLKYYMRGLGIGIILTTLIFTITGTEENLSDKEIMQRARVLGMVTEEEQNAGLEEVLNNKPTNSAEEPTKKPEEPSLTPTNTPEELITPTPTVEPTPEPTMEPTTTPTIKPEPSIQPSQISFTIEKGMASGQVANLLVKVGLIEDATAFNRYIVYQGKESIIRIGSYTLPQDASYDDIINEITAR